MRLTSFAFALTLIAPLACATAQRGGGIGGRMGGMGGRRGAGGGANQAAARADAFSFPTTTELQRYNPADLLIARKGDLALTDAQVTPLTSLRQKINERNADLFARYDSVRKDYRPPSVDRARSQGGSRQRPDSAPQDAMAKMRKMRFLLDTLATRRILDVSESVALLSGDLQKQRAVDFLAQQEKELRSKLPQAGRGRP